MSYALDTNYAQETVESPIWHLVQDYDLSNHITYDVFGDVYVGMNDWVDLYCITDPVIMCGSYPGPGTFDN
jgi:hypothetical protein